MVINGLEKQKRSVIYGIKNILNVKVNCKNYYDYIFELTGYRIVCFTCDKNGNNHHELFWAHYADQNRGVCILYDKDELIKAINNKEINGDYNVYFSDNDVEKSLKCKYAIAEVDYSGRKIISFADDGHIKEGFSVYDFIVHKGKAWSYEQEIRLVFDSEKFCNEFSYYIKISPKCIKEIRFGYCLDNCFCDEIVEMYKGINCNIRFSKMSISDTELKLIPTEYVKM